MSTSEDAGSSENVCLDGVSSQGPIVRRFVASCTSKQNDDGVAGNDVLKDEAQQSFCHRPPEQAIVHNSSARLEMKDTATAADTKAPASWFPPVEEASSELSRRQASVASPVARASRSRLDSEPKQLTTENNLLQASLSTPSSCSSSVAKRRAWSFSYCTAYKGCQSNEDTAFTAANLGPQPPLLMQQSALMVRVYYVNHAWKSVIAKSIVVLYLSVIFYIMFRASNPWYEFFYYLTLQGWTLELVYFSFSLYLDLLVRIYGNPDAISRVSKAAAQALSELVFAVQVVIVMFFWLVVYPQETWRSVMWELNCHGMGLLLMVADYLYRFTGFSLRNHKYIVVFALLYTSLYTFVVLGLKRQVYPGIDFRSVRSALTFLAGLSTVVFTHKIFYLISNWRWIKEDVKSVLGISKVLLFRQSSFDMFIHGVPEFGTELFSIPARATPLSHAAFSRRSQSVQLTPPEPKTR